MIKVFHHIKCPKLTIPLKNNLLDVVILLLMTSIGKLVVLFRKYL